ncbi:MAG: SDR family oxidoreductase, partial [Opitutales bacterium]|nr:SDR family oxidoreductase [Opitutales bacterium]
GNWCMMGRLAECRPVSRVSTMKALFIGGTGVISSACSRLAVERGIELWHLNRGKSSALRAVSGVRHLQGDIRDEASIRERLKGHRFDVVVNWVAFVPSHVEADIRLFSGLTDQYVFISSASAYQTPPEKLPVTEDTPLDNPVWQYSRDKIACERVLESAHVSNGFPYTIVRPSHTYDPSLIPVEGGYTVISRMLRGKPVVVHGDGSSIWTLTHHRDFAKGLVGLLGKNEAIGQAYQITSDEWLTWNQILITLGRAFGCEPELVTIPSRIIARYDKAIGDSLLGDKTASMVFDNSKIKALVPNFHCEIPFSQGAKEIAAWYQTHPELCVMDPDLEAMFDHLIEDYGKAD